MNLPWAWRSVVGLTLLLSIPGPAAAQVADPKSAFVDAFTQFSFALEGAQGDEGTRILASLDALDRGLTQWDAAIRGYEAAVAGQPKDADPKLAGLAHMALGGIYLDRGRVADALREFTAASVLDPARADAYTLQGIASSPPFPDNAAAAVLAFQKAAALDPTDVVSAYLLGRKLARAGKSEDAAKAWRLVLANQKLRADERTVAAAAPFMRFGIVEEKSGVEPFFPPAAYARGFTLLGRGEYAQALASFRMAASSDPLVADQANRYGTKRAADAFRDGSIEAAIEQLQAAIELAPGRAEPHRVLGMVYLADEQYDRAIDELKKALSLNAGDERARLSLADALARAERFDAAEQSLRETIARLPESGRAHYSLARLFQRQGKQPEALKEFQAAVAFNPLIGLNGIYQTMGALAAARQNFDAALDAYSQRVEVQPNAADAHQELGDTYARVSRSDEALAEFAVALSIDPNRASAYASLSQIYLRQGQYDAAVTAARRSLDIDPAQQQTRYALGTALMRLGRAEEGEKELKEFERLQQEAAAGRARDLELGTLRREAQMNSASGDHQKAVALLRRALELAPADPIAHLNLGMALILAGQPAEAVEQLTATVAMSGPAEAHQHLATAYAALGRADDSRRELEVYEQLKRNRLQQGGAPR
jgi:tetratricopeptide (TPR) repeat protein